MTANARTTLASLLNASHRAERRLRDACDHFYACGLPVTARQMEQAADDLRDAMLRIAAADPPPPQPADAAVDITDFGALEACSRPRGALS